MVGGDRQASGSSKRANIGRADGRAGYRSFRQSNSSEGVLLAPDRRSCRLAQSAHDGGDLYVKDWGDLVVWLRRATGKPCVTKSEPCDLSQEYLDSVVGGARGAVSSRESFARSYDKG